MLHSCLLCAIGAMKARLPASTARLSDADAHFGTDVLAGQALGVSVAILYFWQASCAHNRMACCQAPTAPQLHASARPQSVHDAPQMAEAPHAHRASYKAVAVDSEMVSLSKSASGIPAAMS